MVVGLVHEIPHIAREYIVGLFVTFDKTCCNLSARHFLVPVKQFSTLMGRLILL